MTLATGGVIRLISSRGERVVPAVDFFLGPLSADIEPDEIAVAVSLPVVPARTGVAVMELTYRTGDYAVVGVVAQVSLDVAGAVDDCRIALFGVDATPLRVTEAEVAIREAGIDHLDAAAELAVAVANPASDATASAEYRRDMIRVYCRRAVRAAMEKARLPETRKRWRRTLSDAPNPNESLASGPHAPDVGTHPNPIASF